MSKIRTHPIYYASPDGGGTCGHQHSYEQSARNCADNQFQRHPNCQSVAVSVVKKAGQPASQVALLMRSEVV